MLFFNPFSVEILQKVLARIYESYYENPREILLMFYYPSEEYISCLMTEEALMFVDEISTEDLFEVKNERERILIFSVEIRIGTYSRLRNSIYLIVNCKVTQPFL